MTRLLGIRLFVAVVCTSVAIPVVAQSPHRPTAQTQTTPAPAPVPNSPQVTTATYGDWTLRCTVQTDAKTKSCEISQAIQIQGQAEPFAQFGYAIAAQTKEKRFVVVVPNNVSFTTLATIKANEKDLKATSLTWRRCLPVGCIAEGSLTDTALAQFRAQAEKGVLQFHDGSDRVINVPLSLRGFSQAADALEAAQ
jgi:invasion protein IalB